MKMVKCVVWDLDDTLWHGTLSAGDELVPRDGVVDLVKTLDARGVLQSVASKNNHDDAMRVLEGLGLAEYFLYPQINWNSKSSSVAAIREKLNIGIDTIMFVDDQPFERDEVAFAHPEVETVDSAQLHTVLSMPRLNPKVVTEDASRRRLMYLEDQARHEAELDHRGPADEFLGGLGMIFAISRAKDDDLLRLEELTERTNQLNSTGIQYSYEQLDELMRDPDHDLWVCELTDRYGSYGKIGMALVEKRDDRWTINLLLMSCRTVSKGVGTVLLSFLLQRAADHGKRLFARFRRTDRNRQMLVTYQLANFRVVSQEGNDHLYENDLALRQGYPEYIKVEIDA
ncbi:HAD-IIIC family phosphatase [Saccharothrix sp. 6-C]|uniref:HAD-IIIC family phosphatase n=1 Tax=Saccharothrix sp. 6-C TaxID=2781735 RepID=UPI00191744BA|nr:HAD-IIIC family phosphatase [Saccharothrix sp. 6-C]QQQ73929.1 HAD-IIIC family phosphatase [Saccharothrix sp. 6-C]